MIKKVTLIKRKVQYCYISGAALKAQRKAAGVSQKALADLINAVIGLDYNQMTISRWELMYEFPLDFTTACIVKKILS